MSWHWFVGCARSQEQAHELMSKQQARSEEVDVGVHVSVGHDAREVECGVVMP